MDTNEKRSIAPIAIIAAVLVAGGIGAYAVMNKDEGTRDTQNNNTNTGTGSQNPSPQPVGGSGSGSGGASPTPAPAPNTSSSDYKNGSYSATGTYLSPGGQEQVKVDLTLNNDVITAVTFTSLAKHPTSKQMQARFASGYEALVRGKDIDSVDLTVVSGSSLTPIGFEDALTKIKAQAEA